MTQEQEIQSTSELLKLFGRELTIEIIRARQPMISPRQHYAGLAMQALLVEHRAMLDLAARDDDPERAMGDVDKVGEFIPLKAFGWADKMIAAESAKP